MRVASRRSDLVAIVFVIAIVSTIYGARLSLQPLVGEETRWATGAREMLATGDWVVARQQGRVFPERPPGTMWAMAAAGWLRGDVDPIAIRLPSVVAVVLTSLLVYGYTRAFASPFAATTAALAYATMGQVLQIGRLGESEALFALLVAASLLVWHLGYVRGWRPAFVWVAGFTLAALAALVKGPQAPVYFGAITGAYLLLRGDWRYLLSWQCATGAVVFAIVIAAWQIPYFLATNFAAVVATWSGLAGDRFQLSGVLAHAVTYPLETFACLLPWSPILVALAKRETRDLLRDQHKVTSFLFTAILVAYPTVWLATGARGRYFMPLYPLVAVVVGLVIDRCSYACVKTYPRRAWHQFLLLWGIVIGASAILFTYIRILPNDFAARFYQPNWFSLTYAVLSAAAVFVLWKVYRRSDKFRPIAAVGAVATIAGIGFTGLMVNVNKARWRDPVSDVADFKEILPSGARLVSLTAIEHRFAYYFHDPIAELDWPMNVNDAPTDTDYFCFMREPGDTAAARSAGRGRTWYKTPGTLPFAWEEVTSICVERQVHADRPRTVVLGRVVRPLRATVSDVTVPQSLANASTTAPNTRSTERSRMQR